MPSSPGMLTDHYELTMLATTLREGTADTPCVFEVFARRLPPGRRYGVVAGTGRVVDAITSFRFDEEDLAWLERTGVVDVPTRRRLADFRFTGRVDAMAEGEVYMPGTPLLTITGSFAEAVVLETIVLSILNHDAAVAAAAARMVSAAHGRPIIDMGTRRTHERAAVAAARAAYVAGFVSTSNLAAGVEHGIPTAGTAAHAFTLLHVDEETAFRAQVAQLGPGTTLLVDTYDISVGIERAVAAAGPDLGAIRIDSGDLGVLAHHARRQLDSLGNTRTRIVVSGDLDEYAIAALAAAPVDVYGAGTAVVTGSGAPTAGLVYKLAEVAGRPVAKRSPQKETEGGGKTPLRAHRASGTATEDVVLVGRQDSRREAAARLVATESGWRALHVPVIVDGEPTEHGAAGLVAARERCAASLRSLPWEGLSLSRGDAALETRSVPV